MKIRIPEDVHLRSELFGGVGYVHHRNDFFFLDKPAFLFLGTLGRRWRLCSPKFEVAARRLAQLGLCETAEPTTLEMPACGPAFVGNFEDIPKVSLPLVLNCFCTTFCPLQCRYCHADDLMKPFREGETEKSLDAVVRSARLIDSMVAVITGGDPLTRPERAIRLIEELAPTKPLVLDTSGVPNRRSDFHRLLPCLIRNRVHVRVSLDALRPDNDWLRPINKKIVEDGSSAHDNAVFTIRECLDAGIALTVQSVLTARNDIKDNLLDFAEMIYGLGVRNWVIHVVARAGKGRDAEKRGLFPAKGRDYRAMLGKFPHFLESRMVPMDLRITDLTSIRHSVLLVGGQGDLFTEGWARLGKQRSYRSDEILPGIDLWKDVDPKAHVARYCNWIDGLFPGRTLSSLTIQLPGIHELPR